MKIIVLITAEDESQAKKISIKLLENKLVACCNIIKDVKSFFWWNSKIDSSSEVMLVAKTTKKLFSKVVKLTKKYHSYDVPEIIALPIVDGSQDFLKWIDTSVSDQGECYE